MASHKIFFGGTSVRIQLFGRTSVRIQPLKDLERANICILVTVPVEFCFSNVVKNYNV